jgi:superoxide dismutase, Fe-Mn family
MTGVSRRHAMGAIGLTAAAMAGPSGAQTLPSSVAPVYAGNRAPSPLRFDPAKLVGLSERLIRSHWDNNYMGSLKTLNMIEGRMAAAMADKDLPPIVYAGLKREQLLRTGSVILHEHYFHALGGDGVAGGAIKAALASRWGSFDAWEAEFRRTAMSLAGGSGWCTLVYNLYEGTLSNHWASDHSQQPPASLPLIALDMYEHAFHIDYGAAAAKYVDAYMRNLDWEVIEARWQAIKAIKTS